MCFLAPGTFSIDHKSNSESSMSRVASINGGAFASPACVCMHRQRDIPLGVFSQKVSWEDHGSARGTAIKGWRFSTMSTGSHRT